MLFTETKISGAFVIDLERRTDERGYFARVWCQQEFQDHGLTAHLSQVNVSFNTHQGTLRGMHFQRAPFQEAKVVSCTRGAIYDVVLDLRPQSSTYLQWVAVELTEANRRMLFIPEGCAHGFQTLHADCELLYLMSQSYSPGHGSGVRYDDEAFNIAWPMAVQCISEADRTWPNYSQ